MYKRQQSPERIPKKRKGEYNTTAISNEGRAFIVDNQTLEGEPAPNAELAWELHQSVEERRARFDLLLNTDSKIASLCPAWREQEAFWISCPMACSHVRLAGRLFGCAHRPL